MHWNCANGSFSDAFVLLRVVCWQLWTYHCLRGSLPTQLLKWRLRGVMKMRVICDLGPHFSSLVNGLLGLRYLTHWRSFLKWLWIVWWYYLCVWIPCVFFNEVVNLFLSISFLGLNLHLHNRVLLLFLNCLMLFFNFILPHQILKKLLKGRQYLPGHWHWLQSSYRFFTSREVRNFVILVFIWVFTAWQ